MHIIFIAATVIAGGLALLSATLVQAGLGGGGGGGCHERLSNERGSEVAIRDFCFTPTVIRVEAGESVTWTNEDDVPHNVVAVGATWSDSKPLSSIAKGDSASLRFDEPGIFPFYCGFHPAMIGVVAVGDGFAGAAGHVDAAPSSSASAHGSSGVPAELVGAASLAGLAAVGAVGFVASRKR